MSDEKKNKKSAEKQEGSELSLQEARAYRASLHKEKASTLTEEEKREKFRIFWAEAKSKYGKAKDIEAILWEHLKSSKNSDPENFEKGLQHFGLKKIR